MATVVEVALVPELDTGTSTITEEAVTNVYRVFFDNTDEGHGEVWQAINATDGTNTVPAIGAQLVIPIGTEEIETGLYVTKKEPRRSTNPLAIDVYVTYSNQGFSAGQTGKWNVDVSSDGIITTVPQGSWADGSLIVNSAGVAYPNGVSMPVYDEKFTVSFMTDSGSLAAGTMANLRGYISSAEVTLTVGEISFTRVFPPFTLRLANATWKSTYSVTTGEDTWSAFSVQLELEYRHQIQLTTATGHGDGSEIGWLVQLPDIGFDILDAKGKVKPIVEQNRKTHFVRFLNGEGKLQTMTAGSDGLYPGIFLPPNIPKPGVADLNVLLDGIS